MTDSVGTTRKYNFQEIETKWQSIWEEQQLFKAPDKPDRDNSFYMLEMFAYPSGDIHMGHFRNYIIGDAVARHQMMLGKDVLHPFGWDSFGLPAERAAIKRNIHPADWTVSNIAVSRTTLQKVGISFDWSREISTCSPEYYKFTQWIFLRLFEKGLAYRKRGFVNWCPEDKTVLANEQVVQGRCERCGTEVEKKEQVQWYFKITDYADRLIDDLETLPEWPDNVKTMQREWIGRSYGAEIVFSIEDSDIKLPVFTTRPDTTFGVTFMAIAPESELLKSLNLDPEHEKAVNAYCKKAMARTDIERSNTTEEKDGVFTGKYAINPFNGEKVQLWVADYVLAGYGTGIVMAVPAHDSRDFAFARKYDIPVKVVIHSNTNTTLDANELTEAYTEPGVMVNSDKFDGLVGKEAIKQVTKHAEDSNFGSFKVNFKLKDWSISRQRYWGCPIPIIHCKDCGEVPVPDDQLPVVLPKIENFIPKGRSPLADVPEYINVKCPKCGGEAERDADTMDTFNCSSWYYLRYLDPHNEKMPFDPEKADNWLPIDMYIGGISHATAHLIYFRFFHKFLYDIGLLKSIEPAKRLFNHGMVMDSSGEVMRKSLGNVVSPIELMAERGVDVCRLGMYFVAPSEREVIWTDDSLTGVEKFTFKKIFPLSDAYRSESTELKYHFNRDELNDYDWSLYLKLNQTIKRVSEDIERLQFNTVIAAIMELVRDYDSLKTSSDTLNNHVVRTTLQLVAPMIPHLAEELWHNCGFKESIFKSQWPKFDKDAIVAETITIAVQVNGKLRDSIEIAPGADQETVERTVFESNKIKQYTQGKEIIKKIYVPGRIFNIVAKG